MQQRLSSGKSASTTAHRLDDLRRSRSASSDPVAEVLRQVRADDAVVDQVAYRTPWSVRYATPPPLTIFAVLAGRAWLVPLDGPAQAADRGDLIVAQGSVPYVLSDSPDRSVRTETASTTVVFSGVYPTAGKIHPRLLSSLPPLMHLPADDNLRSLLDVMVAELAQNQPGQRAMVDRLLDLLLARVVRAWVTRSDTQAGGWSYAFGDSIVGPALLALHEHPAHHWTVASLAAVSDVSRVTFARHFTQVVGEPPVTYLTRLRMTLAADMLQQPGSTVATVARHVGYADPFGFSTAFKRAHGMSPSRYRAAF